MDVQVYHKKNNLQKEFQDRQFVDGVNERRLSTLIKNEVFIADVFYANSSSGSCSRPRKTDFHHPRQQTGQIEQNCRPSRPNYTSLADIYEGALRKVLNLQLNLKIEEQPRFHEGNDFAYRDKMSPPRSRVPRMEDDKRQVDFRHRRDKSEEENDSRIAPQGRSLLRKISERSNAESSAFHVPSKRRYDVIGYERDSEHPMDRFGRSRHTGPEYPMDYGHSHYHPRLYGRDPIRRARLAPSYLSHRGMAHESYHPRYSRFQRDVPPLFPVRCSSIEREGQTAPRGNEHEGRDYKYPDGHCNGERISKFSSPKMSIAKIEKEENDKLEETFNKAIDNLSQHIEPNSPRHSPERKSPHSERYQPYSRRIRPSPPLKSEADKNGENDGTSMENDRTPDVKKGHKEDGEKEEFLSNLGLARI